MKRSCFLLIIIVSQVAIINSLSAQFVDTIYGGSGNDKIIIEVDSIQKNIAIYDSDGIFTLDFVGDLPSSKVNLLVSGNGGLLGSLRGLTISN